jgi:hypothetical protein
VVVLIAIMREGATAARTRQLSELAGDLLNSPLELHAGSHSRPPY